MTTGKTSAVLFKYTYIILSIAFLRKIYWRKCLSSCFQQLWNHFDFYCICVWLQYWMFGYSGTVLIKIAVYTTLIAGGVLCEVLVVLGACFCTDLLLVVTLPKMCLPTQNCIFIFIFWVLFLFCCNIAKCVFSAIGD